MSGLASADGKTRSGLERLERIAQKLTVFCNQNSIQLFDLPRFLIARTLPFATKAR